MQSVFLNSIKLTNSARLVRQHFSLIEKLLLCPLVAQLTILIFPHHPGNFTLLYYCMEVTNLADE